MNRRQFMKRAGAVSGGSIIYSTQGLAASEKRKWKDRVQSFDVASAGPLDTATDSDSGSSSHDRYQFHGASVDLLDVYKTNHDGWQATVCVNGHAFGRQKSPDGEWKELPEGWDSTIHRGKFTVINAEKSYNPPDTEDGYNGWTPGNGAKSEGPEWLEPVLDTGISTLIGLASSNPYTGAAAGVALAADDIMEELAVDDGKSLIHKFDNGHHDGFEVSHTVDAPLGFGDEPQIKMSGYQRFTIKAGKPTYGPEAEIESIFETNFHGSDSDEETRTSFTVSFFDDGDGGDGYTGNDFRVENMTEQQKREQGIVRIENGEVQNQVVKSKLQSNNRVDRIVDKVGDEELRYVALDPVVNVSSH